MCGDYNIDLLKVSEHQDTKYFLDGMFTDGFKPLIQEPTRITKDSATVIDNIFCNSKTTLENSGAIIYDISDHLPIFTVTNAGKGKDVVDDNMNIQIGLSEKDMNLI